jgi:muconate cycloisomerase (EC 5.5.1.1)
MKITDIELYSISVPLRTPFKTALRTVTAVEDIIVKINTDEGVCGYGEAPPTGVITGDTSGSIIAAIRNHIEKAIVGMDIEDFEEIMEKLHKSVIGNYSAKAAVDMALYDLFGQKWEIPLYKHLGGSKKK